MNIRITRKGNVVVLQLLKRGKVWYECSATTSAKACEQMLIDLANRDDPKATPRVRILEG